MRFRPHPLATVGVVLALPILIGLATWQANRHVEQAERLAVVESRLYEAPATNEQLVAVAGSELSWRKAVVTGRFRKDTTPFLVTGRFEFGSPGFDVIMPLELEGGGHLLVNRGWIPSEGWRGILDNLLAADEIVTLEGLLQDLDGRTDAEPIAALNGLPERYPRDVGPATGCIPSVGGPPYGTFRTQLEQGTGGLNLLDVVLVAGPELKKGQSKQNDGYPVQGYVAVPKQIGHFEYSVQWGLIALTLIAVWIYGSVQRGASAAREG